MIKLKAPKGMYGVSWQGEEFYIDKKGIVEVPGEALPELLNFGYKVVDNNKQSPLPPSESESEGAKGGEGQGETDEK